MNRWTALAIAVMWAAVAVVAVAAPAHIGGVAFVVLVATVVMA